MIHLVFGKLLRSIVIFGVVLTLIFVMARLLPGTPLQSLTGASYYNQDVISAMSQKYGLNEPVLVQYGIYLKNIFHGEFGKSIRTSRDINTEVAYRLPKSIPLFLSAIFFSFLIAIIASILFTIFPRNWALKIITELALFFSSVAPFILGLAVLFVAALVFNYSPQIDDGTTLALLSIVIVVGSYFIRHITTLAKQEAQKSNRQYFLALTARGIPEYLIWFKHILRNILIPITTIGGFILGYLIVGGIVIEVIFGIPGLGRMFFDGILYRDYPVIQGIAVIAIAFFALSNLIVDILHIIIDPRLKRSQI